MGQMGHMASDASEGFIPPHGGYAGQLAYQKALIVFQATCRFCERFLEKRDRTIDQMIQGARPWRRAACAKQSRHTARKPFIP
jgi:hypothetical protein